MMYYVIKNIDTNEYWRGKGNQWGKYFNQAVVYRVKGMAESVLSEITRYRCKGNIKIVTISIIEHEDNT